MGRPFEPGQSGNPGGRPRLGPEFRSRARELAQDLLDRIEEVLPTATPSELVRALEVVADRGGYLAGDRLAAAELSRAQMLVRLLETTALGDDEKKKIIAALVSREQEALGEQPLEMKAAG